MDLQKRLSEIEERLAKSTPGPWACDQCGDVWSESIVDIDTEDTRALGMPLFRAIGTTTTAPNNPDADLIAHAPDDLRLLLALVKEYRAALEQIDSEWCPHSNIRLDQNENLSRDWCCACSNWIYRGETNPAREALRRGEEMG